MQMKNTVFALLGVLLPTLGLASSVANDANSPAQSINASNADTQPDSNGRNDKQPLPRGQLLYENHCGKCQESLVHIRENHKAKSFADVQSWVIKWQAHEKLGWKNDEILDVTRYLANRFYKFK